MIKIYGMDSCPDCQNIKQQIKDKLDIYQYIDIGSNVKLLKEFISLRDNNPIFDDIKKEGKLGIPCFVLENNEIILDVTKLGFKPANSVCSLLDKKGC